MTTGACPITALTPDPQPSLNFTHGIMKTLLLLVLTVCAVGAQGRTVSQTPVTDPQLETVTKAFWEYVSKADESLKQMQLSELGKEVNTLVSRSSEAASRFSDALRTQLVPLSQELMHKFNTETQLLQKRLEKDVSSFSSKITPYTQELMSGLQKQVEDLQKEAAAVTQTWDSERLKSSLIQKTQSQMSPVTQEMKQKMEQTFGDFQSSLLAMSQNVESQMNEKIEGFAPYGEEIRGKLELEAENMRQELETLWKSFTKMF